MTYEYLCNSCGKRFDHQQRMNDPKPPCPCCGGEVRRQISRGTSFTFKGGYTAENGYS